jgi:hypothetical protein
VGGSIFINSSLSLNDTVGFGTPFANLPINLPILLLLLLDNKIHKNTNKNNHIGRFREVLGRFIGRFRDLLGPSYRIVKK